MSVLARLARREERAYTRESFSLGTNPGSVSGVAASGIAVNQDSAMQLPVVYGSIRLYSGVVGSLPLRAWDVANGGHVVSDNAPGWMTKPTPEDTLATWTDKLIASYWLDGNVYCYKVRGADRRVQFLFPIDPRTVSVDRDPSQGYRLRYYIAQPGLSPRPMYSDEILHIPNITLPGYVKGLSPIAYARNTIGSALALEEQSGRYFANGSRMSGVIESNGTELTADNAAIIRDSFQDAHSGLDRAFRPGVLPNGMTWKPLSVTPEEAQFLQSRGYSAEAIAGQLFGIPPHMLGIAAAGVSSWGSGIEQLVLGWMMTGLNPLLSKFEAALTEVLEEDGYFDTVMAWETERLLRSDTKTRWETYFKQFTMGVSFDEIRAKEGDSPLEDGEGAGRFRMANLVPLNAPAALPSPKVPAGWVEPDTAPDTGDGEEDQPLDGPEG